MKEITRYALIDSLGTAVYVILVASLIYSLGHSGFEAGNALIVPIFMLLLFIFSAAFTGLLVFGRPVMWYLDGNKKEAMSLLFYTLGILLVTTVIAFLVLILLIQF